MNDPKDTSNPINNTPIFNDSHFSKHYREGTYDHGITQKGTFGDNTFHSWTDVDKNGSVGGSGFGNFGKK